MRSSRLLHAALAALHSNTWVNSERRSNRPAHGYAVIEEIRCKSGQAFDLPEATIYPALHRLEQAGLLVSR
jgi:DNA-binding PadR family transcriptional regulator